MGIALNDAAILYMGYIMLSVRFPQIPTTSMINFMRQFLKANFLRDKLLEAILWAVICQIIPSGKELYLSFKSYV